MKIVRRDLNEIYNRNSGEDIDTYSAKQPQSYSASPHAFRLCRHGDPSYSQQVQPPLTRIEAHLSDEHMPKSGPQKKRRLLEARPKEHQALTVTDDSPDKRLAVTGAAHKMQRLLESTFGRIEAKRSILAIES
jgi:hypothetical protein